MKLPFTNKKQSIKHDNLCVIEPCICFELEQHRELKNATKAISEMQKRNELAIKALKDKL